jgi:hypothetical protein
MKLKLPTWLDKQMAIFISSGTIFLIIFIIVICCVVKSSRSRRGPGGESKKGKKGQGSFFRSGDSVSNLNNTSVADSILNNAEI